MDSLKYVFARFNITLTVGRQGGVDPFRLFTLAVFEGLMPDFSPPGIPPPSLPLESTRVDGHTQTGATYTRDKATHTFIDVTDAATQVSS